MQHLSTIVRFAVCCALCALVVPAFAQITITKQEMPTPGYNPRFSIGDSLFNLDLSQTGANTIWDFSALTPVAQRVDSFISPQNAPFSFFFSFPTATVALPQTSDTVDLGFIKITESYSFFRASNSAYINLGFGAVTDIAPFPLSSVNQPGDTVYRFPLTYNNSLTAYSASSISFPSLFSYNHTQTRSYTVDGWGTITTPYGTFSALRVRDEVNATDSVSFQGTSFPAFPSQTIEYKWLTTGEKAPILTVTARGVFGSEVVSNIAYRDSVRSGVITLSTDTPRPEASVQVFPNPTVDAFSIKLTETIGTDARLSVFDATGRKLIETHFTPGDLVGAQNFAAGTYTVLLTSSKGSWSGTLVVRK